MRVKNLILILGVIVAYLGIIVYVRISNDRTIEKKILSGLARGLYKKSK